MRKLTKINQSTNGTCHRALKGKREWGGDLGYSIDRSRSISKRVCSGKRRGGEGREGRGERRSRRDVERGGKEREGVGERWRGGGRHPGEHSALPL